MLTLTPSIVAAAPPLSLDLSLPYRNTTIVTNTIAANNTATPLLPPVATGNCLGAFDAPLSHGNLSLICPLSAARSASTETSPHGLVRYMLYLPLYNGISDMAIGYEQQPSCTPGVDCVVLLPGTGAAIDNPQPAVVWFGTSITQGGAASRPGSHFLNGVSRSLGRPLVNWGFAGPGQMQLVVAKYMAQITPPPAAFVIDCLPDMDAAAVASRTVPLVRYLREHGHPTTPIVLVEGTNYTDQWLLPHTGACNPRPQPSACQREHTGAVHSELS